MSNIPLLVNRDNPLLESYIPDLVEIDGFSGMFCERQSAQSLVNFITASFNAGNHPSILSAYRNTKTQERCFGHAVDKFWAQGMSLGDALMEAQRYVASPGESEHQTGLAVDIKDKDYKGRTAGLENAPGQKWLMSHCHEYGYILRYPPDKEHITHIAFEPCHFRYVGKEHAIEIVKSGKTLEEYVVELKQIGFESRTS